MRTSPWRTVMAMCCGVVASALYVFSLLGTMELKKSSWDHIVEVSLPWVAWAKLAVFFFVVVAVIRMRGCNAIRTVLCGTAITLIAFEFLSLSLEIEKHHIYAPRPAGDHDQEFLWMMALAAGVIASSVFHWWMKSGVTDHSRSTE